MKYINMRTIQTLLLLLVGIPAIAQQIPRKASMWMKGTRGDKGILVDSLYPGGTLEVLGLRKTDVLTGLNGNQIRSMEDYGKHAYAIREGDEITLTVIRNAENKKFKGLALVKPLEKNDLADVQYDWVAFRNGYLRAITRKPKGKTGLPAILLIPGYGCGSIENYMGSYNGRLLTEWIKAGYAVVTIEKSGVGDSYQCEPCNEVDLTTDIESFDAGYRYMETLPFVDTQKLFVWGHSMGGVIAPEVAKRHRPRGVMVFGATFRPWNEFLIEMHRIQKPLLENLTYAQTEIFIKGIQKIYYDFFVLKKSPEQLYQHEDYRPLVVSELGYKKGSNDMWGRHWRFWQQIDSLNFAESWQALSCPVLIVHGETDYEQCSRLDPLLMQQTINAKNPGNAQLVIVPALDHFMMKSDTWEQARDNFRQQQYNKGNFNPAIASQTLRWLTTQQ